MIIVDNVKPDPYGLKTKLAGVGLDHEVGIGIGVGEQIDPGWLANVQWAFFRGWACR
jgi:hypothetical protein